MKLLLCRPSPRRNIDAVEMYNVILPVDKLIVQFYGEVQAYTIMQKFFLQNKQYTHLVIAPDDLIVKPKHLSQLEKDLIKFDYPVLTGMCNVKQGHDENLNISYKLGETRGRFDGFDWITPKTLPRKYIFKVDFSGFPLMVIRRDVLEKLSLTNEFVFDGKKAENGGSLDLYFCWHCKTNNIPIYVDRRVNMVHLRASGKIRVGDTPPIIELWRYGEDPVII